MHTCFQEVAQERADRSPCQAAAEEPVLLLAWPQRIARYGETMKRKPFRTYTDGPHRILLQRVSWPCVEAISASLSARPAP